MRPGLKGGSCSWPLMDMDGHGPQSSCELPKKIVELGLGCSFLRTQILVSETAAPDIT